MAVEGFLDISVIAPRIQGDRGADRGFIAGRSGAGKSFFARRVLTSYGISEGWPQKFRGNVFIIDANGTFDYPTQGEFETVEAVKLDPKARALRYVPREDQIDGEHWNALWEKLLNYKYPLMTYVDETRAMEPVFGLRRFERGNFFTAYLTRGRARNKAAILGAQRPVTIPRDIIGQAEWFYVFDLPVEDDRAVIAGTIGEFSDDGERIRDRKNLKRFEFWFKGPDLDDPVRAMVIK
jgi:hypothetical protein